MLESSNIIDHVQNTVRNQIKYLENLLSAVGEPYEKAVELIYECEGKVILVGIGKSAHIGKKIVATMNSLGILAQYLHASEALHGDLGLVQSNDVVICLSKSGDTPEIQAVLPYLKEYSKAIIALTASKESALGQAADVLLDIQVNKELGSNNLAPTASTTAQLVIGDALSLAVMDRKNFKKVDFAKYHPGGALGKNLLMKVGDVSDVSSQPRVEALDFIKEVIVSISASKYGITAVYESQKLIGVITDGDLRRMLMTYADYNHLTAKEIMSAAPKTIDRLASARQAFQLMQNHNIGQVLVFDGDSYYGVLDFHTLLKEGITYE